MLKLKDYVKSLLPFKPTGDQPVAIKKLLDGLKKGFDQQTLLGVTGSGKTFTMANIIQEVQRPTLVISHNKTLAAQLYGEFKAFFQMRQFTILFRITTTTNLKLISLTVIPILKRKQQSMRRLTGYVTLPHNL